MTLSRKLAILLAVVTVAAMSFGGFRVRATPAQAGGSWSAWVYESNIGKLVHVFPDGAPPTEQYFPLPPGTSQPPSAVAISRDGASMAACLYDDAYNPSVRVFDLYANTYIAAYIPSGQIQGCSLSRYSFSEDGTQLAFGILNHYPDPGDPRPDWEVIVMQMNTSAILYRIDSNAPQITALGQDFRGQLPFVTTFQQASGSFPGLITLKPVQWGTEGACGYASLTWNLAQNTVSMGGPYGENGFDVFLPGSEVIWTDTDDAYPKGTLMGPGCDYNVVMYSNKAGDLYPIFNNGAILYGSTFVDDGRRVAVQADFNQWVSIDRSGAVTPLADVERDVWGTPTGYVFFRQGPFGVWELWHHEFLGGNTPQATFLWNGIQDEYWRVIWVNPLTGPGTALNPFPPVPVVGPPPGGLVVGGQARVFTTEGDMLNVRTGPGTNFPIAFTVPPGAIVTLVEGPVTGFALVWWRINAPGYGSGWAVEGAPDGSVWVQTLIPVP